MPPRSQHQYSSLYSHSLAGERRTGFWLYIFGIVLVAACGAAIWWLIGTQAPLPLFSAGDRPTVSDEIVTIELARQRFYIPENYLRSAEQRAGGPVEQIDLHAIWPTMRGFNEADAEAFRDKSPDSHVIYITLNAPTQLWRPAERFYQVYPYYFAGPEEQANFGLMRRQMDAGSGLGDHDVFYRQDAESFHLFHCLRDETNLIPSDCVADKVIEPRTLARYRFRRSLLADWKEIDGAVEDLLAQFVGR